MLPARPSARVVVSASMPRRRQAATVAPKTPQTPVGWKPRRWKPSGAAMPMRVTVSVAATIAARVCAPVAPTASAAAIAAGTTTVATWAIDASCVSSKSRPWQSMPLASAAAAAGTRSARPIALEGPDPASSATASPGRASPTPERGEPAAQRIEDVLARDRAYLGGHVGELEGRRPGRELLRRGPLLGLDRHVLMMPRPAMCLTYAHW